MTNPSKGPDWEQLRSRFPVLQKKTYLNSCSYGALAVDVEASLQRYLDARNDKGADWDYWVGRNEAVRNSVARLLGAEADEVAVTTSVSAGINSLASALNFDGPRNKVVITDFEFPTNAQIWYAQESRGARVVRLTEEDGKIPLEKFAQAIDEETLIVATAQVAFRHGAKQDIPAIAEIAKRKGALTMVDSYQALGTMQFDVKKAGVDFAVGGMLKYLLGTAGIAFFYARQELIESLVPTATGWFAQEDINAMDITRYSPAANARRFEAGTPPVPNTYMAEAGLAILHEIGLEAIERRIGELTTAIKDAATEAGYQLASPVNSSHHGAMITLRSNDDNRLVASLAEDNIVVSCRNGNLRISPHFYNNQADIEFLFRALHKRRDLLV
ncbi:MAG: aminotransferase class V-fold PLP-dependent enzyme [Proteobacteria bacterium]|nr:aminotransferase class V-fold PLP-dependent enzyme [Pseudomonadota bacterium]